MLGNIGNALWGKNKRTALVRKNVIASLFFKGWASVMQLLLVPLTLHCLDVYENGVWLTISSMLLWIDNMDVGLGNGLRNKLAEALALGNFKKAQGVVSSTFVMLILIIVPVVLFVNLFVYNINIYALLNIDINRITNLNEIISVSVLLVGMTFVFKFIGNVYMGLQMPAVSNLFVAIGQTIAVVGTCVLVKLGQHSLLFIAVVNTAAPLFVYMLSFPVTFYYRYSYLKPKLSLVNIGMMKSLCEMGCQFFVLQISSILLFMSLNIIISRFFTPEMVTPYQISYRYFCLIQMLFFVVCTPYWTATTDAYAKKEIGWIHNAGKTLNKILILMGVLTIVMMLASDIVYKLWIGSEITIANSMTALVGIYIMILTISTRYSVILSGMGKLRLQLITTMSAAIIFVPTAILIGLYTYNINNLLILMCVVNMPGLVLNKIQLGKVLNGSANGIWGK